MIKYIYFCSLIFIVKSFKGINWFGFETTNNCIYYEKNNVDYYLKKLNELGFNAIRLPISVEIINNNYKPQIWNEEYKEKNFQEIMEDLFIKTRYYNISILIDIHRLKSGISSPVWYIPEDELYTEEYIINTYYKIIDRYNNNENFIGIDLFNEPHYNTTMIEWKNYIEKVINLFEKRYIKPFNIVINGIDWGKNLSDFETNPLNMKEINKFKNCIKYSPHLYGPSLNYIQSYEKEKLYEYWNKLFGFINSKDIWIGEWGGRFNNTLDLLWIDTLIEYINEKKINSHFFWALNPNSNDVDGLFNTDWTTINDNVLNRIKNIKE